MYYYLKNQDISFFKSGHFRILFLIVLFCNTIISNIDGIHVSYHSYNVTVSAVLPTEYCENWGLNVLF